jgi:hypothetical protein
MVFTGCFHFISLLITYFGSFGILHILDLLYINYWCSWVIAAALGCEWVIAAALGCDWVIAAALECCGLLKCSWVIEVY